MSMEEKKENRGGKREGAGRKKGVESKKILLNLEMDLYETLSDVTNKTFYINAAVRFAYKRQSEFQKYLKSLTKEK